MCVILRRRLVFFVIIVRLEKRMEQVFIALDAIAIYMNSSPTSLCYVAHQMRFIYLLINKLSTTGHRINSETSMIFHTKSKTFPTLSITINKIVV